MPLHHETPETDSILVSNCSLQISGIQNPWMRSEIWLQYQPPSHCNNCLYSCSQGRYGLVLTPSQEQCAIVQDRSCQWFAEAAAILFVSVTARDSSCLIPGSYSKNREGTSRTKGPFRSYPNACCALLTAILAVSVQPGLISESRNLTFKSPSASLISDVMLCCRCHYLYRHPPDCCWRHGHDRQCIISDGKINERGLCPQHVTRPNYPT